MSLSAYARRILPKSVRRLVKKHTKQGRVNALVSPALPACVCIDVGASYYPHVKWNIFLESGATQWFAVEPNENNLGYVRAWNFPAKVRPVTTGLSERGGMQTLYVTHVDSGSSLLEPVIPEGMKHRITQAGMNYFFPVRTVEINTLTLSEVIGMDPASAPVFVKLDTQGTELSILRGAVSELGKRRIVGIEMESTLLAQPVMNGSGKFWEACEYLEHLGFELLDINPIQAPTGLNKPRPTGKRFLNECDAVFALRRDIAQTLPVDYRIALFGFYLANALFEEALSMIEADEGIKGYFAARGADLKNLKRRILALA